MELKVKRLTESAKLPTYATDGSAAFDLYSTNVVQGFKTATHSTGLAFEIPEDHVMLVFSRSGHGFKSDIRLANCVAVIDSDYRGDVKVKLTSDSSAQIERFHRGDRVAQALILPVERVQFLEVGELSGTVRGEGGFGHSGK